MKTNAILFYILAIVFFAAAAIYILWSLSDPGSARPANTESTVLHPEWVGAVAITLSGALALFIAVYLSLVNRSTRGVLPEDRLDADIDDGDPELGHFSPWSWWPITLAFGLGLMFLGLAVGVWIAIIGAPIALIAVIGWQFEYYRGNFAR